MQDFALQFDNEITRPLVNAGFAKFNVFDILNINRQELRHSDFLAFLLDPNKSGEIGLQFSRNFLAMLSKDIVPTKLNFFDMFYGNIEKIIVSREVAVKNGRIDILIELEIKKENRRNIVIVIENKVDTGEHDNQLGKYKEFLCERYKDHTKVMLYLSPDKSEPSDNDWTAIDYGFIYTVLNRIDTETADNTIKTLINDYKKTIRSEFNMTNDDELTRQAIEIYKKNRKVLDFIYDSKPDWVKETAKIICELLEQKGATIVTLNNKGALVENQKKDSANIMFSIKDIANYSGYYFQICVKDMLLLFIDDTGKRKCNQQWLFEDCRHSIDAVKRYQELVLFDIKRLKEDCAQMIERAFAKDGVIAHCLSALNNNFPN